MRPAVNVKQWMPVEQMFQWVHQAPDQKAHKRRMCIWLIYTGKLDTAKVADVLAVSRQAVWLWVRQFNEFGPEGLERKGRGGRRWAFLSSQQERQLLRPLREKVRQGKVVKPADIKKMVEDMLSRDVSMSYIYRMLRRHNWAAVLAQSHHERRQAEADDFTKIARPWKR